eukprot:1945672-Prymnesium_polylepis.1
MAELPSAESSRWHCALLWPGNSGRRRGAGPRGLRVGAAVDLVVAGCRGQYWAATGHGAVPAYPALTHLGPF